MNADPAEQLRLLDLADIDRRLGAVSELRTNPPGAKRIAELGEARDTARRELAGAVGTRDDHATEVKRIEADVALAQARIDRDRDRLTSAANMKDAQGLEHEIASLTERLDRLETQQLEAMELLEGAERAVAEQESLIASIAEEGGHLTAEIRTVLESADRESAELTDDRLMLSTGLSAPLLTLYDRLRARGAAGAALLARATCGGCNVVLSPSELSHVRSAAADDVVQCPECSSILVRTDESGL